MQKDSWWLLGFLSAFLAVSSYIIFAFDGTGDSGDSVYHFLIAYGASTHPILFFDHWGKPFFTLLASPFSQFGFDGIQLFNVLLTAGAIWLVVAVAKSLGYRQPVWAGVFLAAAPFVFKMQFSGLTEYLFAFQLICSVWLVLKEKHVPAAVLVSLLPFVRSEGLIIIGVFAFYFLLEKHYRALAWLAFGHVAYGLIGSFYKGSPLWVINNIPYATPGSVYGSGSLDHFVVQLFYVVGPVLYGLWIIGLLTYLAKAKTYWKKQRIELVLVVGGFLAYFVAHSLFWYLGIFNSMGLKRVLIAVMPLIAIICLNGLQTLITLEQKLWPQAWLSRILVPLAVLFLPFTSNKSAILWPSDFELTPEQRLLQSAADHIRAESLSQADQRIFYAAPYAAIALGIDHFNQYQHGLLEHEVLPHMLPGEIAIWDNWYAPTDKNVQLEQLLNQYQLTELQRFTEDSNGRKVEIVILKK